MPALKKNGSERRYCSDSCAGRARKLDSKRLRMLFEAGRTVKELAQQFKAHPKTIRRHLHASGVGKLQDGCPAATRCRICGKPVYKKWNNTVGRFSGTTCRLHQQEAAREAARRWRARQRACTTAQ
jgi:hypothetical protein